MSPRSIGVSLVAHAALLFGLWRRAPARVPPVSSGTVIVAVAVHRTAPTPIDAVREVRPAVVRDVRPALPHPSRAPRSQRSAEPSTRAGVAPTLSSGSAPPSTGTEPREAQSSPLPSAAPSSPHDTSGTPQPVDLFAPSALSTGIGTFSVSRDPGGRTRRPGDGVDPLAGAADRERAASHVHAIVGELLGTVRAQQGAVDPAWRDVERRIDHYFDPPYASLTDENRAITALRPFFTGKGDGEPVDTCVALFLVESDASGRVTSVRLERRSGRRQFDREALLAVERAAAEQSLSPERGATRTRWEVAATAYVVPPVPSLGFGFDEHGITLIHPFKKMVRKRVRLLSVEPL